MKNAGIYTRISTPDHSPEPQLLDLHQVARARGYEIVGEYSDTLNGAKSKRPGLEAMLTDARRNRLDVMVWAFDRMARSVRHFSEVRDELNHLNIEFLSFREAVDTSGPLGRAKVAILGAIAEFERNLIWERVNMGHETRPSRRATDRPSTAGY
ncbi:MAG TPA: recombinase family protein [Candidatus Sulfotelmatobacter sp.]|nr:recombinase family protein [Candidatus Sulfotelmatobacter sp.]